MSYRKRLRLLIGGFIIICLLAYSTSVKNTLLAREECTTTQEKLSAIESAPAQIAAIENELAQMEKQVGANAETSSDVPQRLLQIISRYCQTSGTTLREMPRIMTFLRQDYTIETAQVSVEGSFAPLLVLAWTLERKTPVARIVSIEFSSQKDYRSQKNRLLMTMYFQKLKKNENTTPQ